jgi:hypothetical protein
MPRSTFDTLAKVFNQSITSTVITPAPELKRSSTGNAIKRCRAAWQRAFNTTMKIHGNDSSFEYDATKNAAKAYCMAMPVLADHESIRNFIACVAHGILVDALPDGTTGQLLYAAQVASASVLHQQRSAKPKKSHPTPSQR